MAERNAATPGAAAIPDLNDPAVKLDRASAMAAINARRRETVAKDMAPEDAAELLATPREASDVAGIVDEDADNDDAKAAAERARLEKLATEAEKTKEETPEPDAPNLDAAAQVAKQTETLTLTDDDLRNVKIKMIVNGEERFVTGEEMRSEAQKTSAADKYLETAKELLKEAKAKASLAASAPNNPEPDTPAGPDTLDQAVEQLFNGQEAEAKRLFKLAMSSSGKPADSEAMTHEIEQRIVIRSALRQFAKDHKDIVADPYARNLADRFLYEELDQLGVKELQDLNADAIPEVLEKAGLRTKNYFREKAGMSATASAGGIANTLSERLKRKAAIDELPAAATRGSMNAPAPKTASDVLNEMRAARGQKVV